MKQKLIAFFSGRNGTDTLAKVAMFASLPFLLVSFFMPLVWLRLTLYALALGLLIYANFRTFSRNLAKRRKENAAFCEYFRILKLKWKGRKLYRYFRCPHCKAWLRVPKKKGHTLTVTCRSCHARFDKKI